MTPWKISTETYTQDERVGVWSRTMDQICLPAAQVRHQAGFYGDVVSLMSPSGIEFSRLTASAQVLSGKCANPRDSIWMALMLDGTSYLGDEGQCVELTEGDIVYGPTGVHSTMQLPGDFCMLYVKVPIGLVHPRLLNPFTLQTSSLSGHVGLNRVFSSMLRAIAFDLEHLDGTQFRPIECALSEFLIACLSEKAAQGTFSRGARATHFNRVCQSIEAQLADPDLCLGRIADEHRVSQRYIQKLFEEAELSFSQYLRNRRLERCKSDLASPAHKSLSISDICYRWGFNDSAHFSRIFHSQYGMTPRAFRQSGIAALPTSYPCPIVQ